ncbi:MAG: DotU family type IV/VI secretion system protein [Candidatus Tectimicrobiota bacterium]
MDSLVALYSKLMAYILLWEQHCLAGGALRSYERVRQDIASLLQEQEVAVVDQGIAVECMLAARLAVLAWVDELVLRHKVWQYHDRWQATPLQAEYYGPGFAETPQYVALQQLFTTEPAVRDVYTLCLCLGFSGRRGSRLTDRLFLPQASGAPGQEEALQHDDVWSPGFTLTPQPYGTPASMQRYRRLALTLAGSLGAAGMLLWLWLSQPAVPPPCVPSPSLASTLQQHLAEQPCSQMSVTVQGCRVTLAGRMASAEQRTALRHLVQGWPEVQQLDDSAVHIVPRPFCEVLGLFEALTTPGASQVGALRVQPNKAGEPPGYVAGEDFTLEVSMPTRFTSYLYVDLYESDGLVRYLYSNQNLGKPLTAGSTQTLGIEQGKPIWGVGPPYGRALVTVIASETPLVFPPPKPGEAPGNASSYLERLQQALAQQPPESGREVAYFFIETRTP